MAGLNLNNINASENEFLSEEILIGIIPNVNLPELLFLSGNFGPLDAGMPCSIPLWLAITLRKRNKCMIIPPTWLTIPSLEQCINIERTQSQLTDLPYHYMEISQLLLTHAREDLGSPDRIAVLLQDIENIRMDRIKLG